VSIQYSIELAVFLFCAVVILSVVARKVAFPFPILLVLAGVGLGLVPRFPSLTIDPDMIFLGCLPPLLFSAAIRMPWHQFRDNLAPISGLALGLVLVTAGVVGFAAHAFIPGMTLAAGFALGAIVAPTDAVAATAIARRLRIPDRVTTILEGESLVNDASGLVAYEFAVLAVIAGTLNWGEMSLRFFFEVGGGIALGLLVGMLAIWVFRRMDDPVAEITFTLTLPFLTFLGAQQLELSGVLAVVAAGLSISRRGEEVFSANSRMDTHAVLATVDFLINGAIFLLIGVQLQSILSGLTGWSNLQLLGFAAMTSGLVLGVRLLWAYPVARLVGYLTTNLTPGSYPDLHWKDQVLVGWAGMRGVVSLAAALALPLGTHTGDAFPDRSLIIFLTASVVLVTLVVNGLSLPLIAGAFGRQGAMDDEEKERAARVSILKAPIAEFDRRMAEESLPLDPTEVMWVRQSLAGRLAFIDGGEDPVRKRIIQNRGLDLYLQLLRVERRELHRLFRNHKLSQESFTKIEREIDLEERGARSQIIDKTAAPHRKFRRTKDSGQSP